MSALLMFMCTGMLCGCQSLQALTGWGKRQEKARLRAMGFPRGQAAVPPTTNEAKACVSLLAGLNLTNWVVTGDAVFMQREVCHLIIKQQGHYRIVLKANQPDLHQTVQDWFEPFPPARRVSTAQRRDV